MSRVACFWLRQAMLGAQGVRGLLGLCVVGGSFLLGLAKAQEGDVEAEAASPSVQIDILIVDVARIRSTADAYISIQSETERVRDVVNDLYQERLANLQQERDLLVTQEFDLEPEDFQAQIVTLEQRAIDLEANRRMSFSSLERRRQEANVAVDIQLNSVLADLLEGYGASYILNQQAALVWPDAANVTEEAVSLLNERLAFVNFEVSLTSQDESLSEDGRQ